MRLSQYLDFYWDKFADFKDLRVVMAWESKYAILPYTVNPSVKREVEPLNFDRGQNEETFVLCIFPVL